VRNGRIYDHRRLCTDFTYFAPRKSDKTGLAAFIQVVFFLLEDYNAEIYCAANASDQAKLLYRRTKDLLRSIDSGQRIRMTETVCDWRPAYKAVRDSSIRPLSAGGKAKDGMFAQLCCADEYGSAAWINGKADMKMLVDVITSSMGPRREPLTLTTTTAGRITSGPFIEKLAALHTLLERELSEQGDLLTDRTLCILYEPDAWERDEHILLTSHKVRAKVNRMLGIIVQHQFYDDEAAKAQLTGDSGEFISKFLNVYKATTVQEWIKPEEVRKLQQPIHIDQLQPVDGQPWLVFTGMDFSLGDDLYAHGYLCVNPALPAPRRFFADLDAWMSREAMEKSPLRSLFSQWEQQGHLHVVDGATVPPEVSLNRIDQLVQSRCAEFVAFGYDPYASKIPINALKSYVLGLGADPEQRVLPCRQTLAAFNSSVDELGYMVKNAEPWITFSDSPLWAFEAGNMVLEEDARMGNKKPVKRAGSSGKIDNWIALLEGLQLFDLFDGKNNEL
jgi:phage terminase large subunit-like protein